MRNYWKDVEEILKAQFPVFCRLSTAADIVERGIVLTGGGALLGELDTTIREATGLPVVIAEDPLTCVVMGTGRCLDEMKSLKNVLIGA